MKEKDKKYRTKDYWEIIFLSARGHAPDEIEVGPEGAEVPQHLIYVFPNSVMEDLDAFSRGVEEVMQVDIRKVRQAIEQFKRNMHRYLPNSRRG